VGSASIAAAAIATSCRGQSAWTTLFYNLPPKLGVRRRDGAVLEGTAPYRAKRIAALQNGGASPELARRLAAESLLNLRAQKVGQPSKIPWR
jgi:hypothetical protein